MIIFIQLMLLCDYHLPDIHTHTSPGLTKTSSYILNKLNKSFNPVLSCFLLHQHWHYQALLHIIRRQTHTLICVSRIFSLVSFLFRHRHKHTQDAMLLKGNQRFLFYFYFFFNTKPQYLNIDTRIYVDIDSHLQIFIPWGWVIDLKLVVQMWF